MGQVLYLDQLRPAGSLRAFAGPMVTATAPPTAAYVYDSTEFSCVVLHSSAYRDACSWRAVALTRAECEREALAHHVAEHLDLHNSAGRTITRKPRPATPDGYRDRIESRLRRQRAFFIRRGYGTVLGKVSVRQRPYVPDALEALAEDESDPEFAAWATRCLEQWQAKQQRQAA